MGCLNFIVKYVILFQVIIQITWRPCQALVEDYQNVTWKYKNRSFKLNKGHVYDQSSNLKKSIEKKNDMQYPNQEGHLNTKHKDTNVHPFESYTAEVNNRSDNNKFKIEEHLEGKDYKGLHFRHSKANNEVENKSLSKKNTKNKRSRQSKNNFNSIMHLLKSKNSPLMSSKVESDDNFRTILLKSNQEELIKRNERDIKTGNHNVNQFMFSNKHDEKMFRPFFSSENNDQLYNNNINEDGQSFMATGDENKQHWRAQSIRLNSTEVGQENNYSKFYSKKFPRRAHESNLKGISLAAETSIEYKEESLLRTTESDLTTIKTTDTTTSTKKKASVKTKTSPKSNKYQSKKGEFEKEKSSSDTLIMDIYEEFLIGQMADNFVNTVLTKAQRSRKIWKELGFRNDSEETCDRCIETKMSKIPDLEAMKSPMKNFSKGNELIEGYSVCFKVPNAMEDFLNLLISFENEHEKSVYNKIKDDSSFIFTGDYPETLLKSENNMVIHDGLIGDKGLFSKESLDKQHIREENNEEKDDYQIQNINSIKDTKFTSFHKINNYNEYTTQSIVDENVDEETKFIPKSMLRKDTKEKENSDDQHTLQSDENVKGNDLIDVFETKDFMSPLRSKKYNNPEPYGFYSDNLIQDRRNFYKHNKGQFSQKVNDNVRESDIKIKKSSDHHGMRKYDYEYPYERNYVEFPNFKKDRSKDLPDRNIESKKTFQVDDNTLFNDNYKSHSPHVRSGMVLNEYTNNDPNYYDQPNVKDVGFKEQNNKNIRDSRPNSLMSKDWENSEYRLYPIEPNRNNEEKSLNTVSRSKSYEGDDSGSQRIAEPYEEDIFIEVPDLEYDLY